VIGAHELAPKKSTHVTNALRRKEGSHDGKNPKLGGGTVGPSAQNKRSSQRGTWQYPRAH